MSILALATAGAAYLDQRRVNDLATGRYEQRYADRVSWWIQPATDPPNVRDEYVYIQNRSLAPITRIEVVVTYWVEVQEAVDKSVPDVTTVYGYTGDTQRTYRLPDVAPCTVVRLRKVESETPVPTGVEIRPTNTYMSISGEIRFMDGQEFSWEKGQGHTKRLGVGDDTTWLPDKTWNLGIPTLPIVDTKDAEDCTDS